MGCGSSTIEDEDINNGGSKKTIAAPHVPISLDGLDTMYNSCTGWKKPTPEAFDETLLQQYLDLFSGSKKTKKVGVVVPTSGGVEAEQERTQRALAAWGARMPARDPVFLNLCPRPIFNLLMLLPNTELLKLRLLCKKWKSFVDGNFVTGYCVNEYALNVDVTHDGICTDVHVPPLCPERFATGAQFQRWLVAAGASSRVLDLLFQRISPAVAFIPEGSLQESCKPGEQFLLWPRSATVRPVGAYVSSHYRVNGIYIDKKGKDRASTERLCAEFVLFQPNKKLEAKGKEGDSSGSLVSCAVMPRYTMQHLSLPCMIDFRRQQRLSKQKLPEKAKKELEEESKTNFELFGRIGTGTNTTLCIKVSEVTAESMSNRINTFLGEECPEAAVALDIEGKNPIPTTVKLREEIPILDLFGKSSGVNEVPSRVAKAKYLSLIGLAGLQELPRFFLATVKDRTIPLVRLEIVNLPELEVIADLCHAAPLLESVIISNLPALKALGVIDNGDSKTKIKGAVPPTLLSGCPSLTEVHLSSLPLLEEVGDLCHACKLLTAIQLNSFPELKVIGNVGKGCERLGEVELSCLPKLQSVASIAADATSIGLVRLYAVPKLRAVQLPVPGPKVKVQFSFQSPCVSVQPQVVPTLTNLKDVLRAFEAFERVVIVFLADWVRGDWATSPGFLEFMAAQYYPRIGFFRVTSSALGSPIHDWYFVRTPPVIQFFFHGVRRRELEDILWVRENRHPDPPTVWSSLDKLNVMSFDPLPTKAFNLPPQENPTTFSSMGPTGVPTSGITANVLSSNKTGGRALFIGVSHSASSSARVRLHGSGNAIGALLSMLTSTDPSHRFLSACCPSEVAVLLEPDEPFPHLTAQPYTVSGAPTRDLIERYLQWLVSGPAADGPSLLVYIGHAVLPKSDDSLQAMQSSSSFSPSSPLHGDSDESGTTAALRRQISQKRRTGGGTSSSPSSPMSPLQTNNDCTSPTGFGGQGIGATAGIVPSDFEYSGLISTSMIAELLQLSVVNGSGSVRRVHIVADTSKGGSLVDLPFSASAACPRSLKVTQKQLDLKATVTQWHLAGSAGLDRRSVSTSADAGAVGHFISALADSCLEPEPSAESKKAQIYSGPGWNSWGEVLKRIQKVFSEREQKMQITVGSSFELESSEVFSF